jgi:hypothetical protein
MKHILWQPFDLSKWLVLGFSAWLAGLADGAGGGGGKYVFDDGDFFSRADIHSGNELLRNAGEWIFWLPILFIVIMAVAAVLVLILWLSSRAKFIYLDNVITNRAEIVDPWHRFRDLGNSLFLWRLAFLVACGLVVIVLALVFIAPAATLSVSDALAGLSFAAMGFGVLILVVFGIVAAYIGLFLEAFVIPIMYKYDLTAMEAWRSLIPWLRAKPWHFILYGLFVLALIFCFVLIFGLFCVLTCCIVALPYVGTVILLPFYVLYRLFSVEFLAQFDPGFDLYALPEEATSE